MIFDISNTGSNRFDIRCVYIVPCKFNALSNNDEFGNLFAKRTKLGPNDHWITSFGEMASHIKIFRVLFDVN